MIFSAVKYIVRLSLKAPTTMATTPTTTTELKAYSRFDLMQTQNELMSFQWIDLYNALPLPAIEFIFTTTPTIVGLYQHQIDPIFHWIVCWCRYSCTAVACISFTFTHTHTHSLQARMHSFTHFHSFTSYQSQSSADNWTIDMPKSY